MVELLLSGWAVMARKGPAPRPPWWGRVLRRVLAQAFWLVGRTLFDVRVRGVERFGNRPATIVVCNHKTDFDVVLLAPTLYRASHGKGPIARLAFVAAERMFQPGYFSTYLVRRPRPLSRLLYGVNLSAVLQALHVYPIPKAHRRKLRAHLLEVLECAGDVPLGAITRRPPEELIPGVSGEARIRAVLRWRHHEALDAEHDFSIFTPMWGKALRERHLDHILRCLVRFAAILDEGDPVFFAPEGDLSVDGGFGEIKAGLVRLIRMAEREVTLLPVNFTYDFMTTGRPTAFLSIGEELDDVKSRPREQVEADVERAITGLGVVTLSQLASRAVRQRIARGEHAVDEDEWRGEVRREAERLAAHGFSVDGRLLQDDERFGARWRRFIGYGLRKGLLERRDVELLPRAQAVAGPPGVPQAPSSPWTYGENELNTILEAGLPS